MKRHQLVLLAVLLLAIATAGCSKTVKGIGEDIENAGDKIEDSTD